MTLLDCQRHDAMNKVARVWTHNNAVLDVKWSLDGSRLVTASGDMSCCVCDVASQKVVTQFVGHEQSVKAVCVNPANPRTCTRLCGSARGCIFSLLLTVVTADLFASGSRDGQIMVWDSRTAVASPSPSTSPTLSAPSKHAPVRIIQGAHVPPRPIQRDVKRRRVRASPPGSVTSVLFLHDGYTVVSSGSTDGCVAHPALCLVLRLTCCRVDVSMLSAVKFWDTRKVPKACRAAKGRKTVAPRAVRTISGGHQSARRHGVTSLDLDVSGSQLLVSYTNSR